MFPDPRSAAGRELQSPGQHDRSVTVLVPVLNAGMHVQSTVDCLKAQDYKGPTRWLFVDGGSTDGTVEMLRGLSKDQPRICIAFNPRRATPAALNVGLEAATTEFVVRFDAHTKYPSHYLRLAVERMLQGDIVSASGPALAEGSGPWSRRIAIALHTRLGTGGATFRRGITREIEIDSGFTGIWRTEDLRKAGGWDEATYPNEDAELAARLRRSGGRIVCLPELAARYHPRDSLRGLARQYWRYGQYRARTSGRFPESMRPSHVLPPTLVLTTVTSVVAHGRLRSLAQAVVGVYVVTTAAVSLLQARSHPTRELLALPVVYGTMHFSWGSGFIWGCSRFGVPVRGIVALLLRACRAATSQASASARGSL